jgi:hypothetical protein
VSTLSKIIDSVDKDQLHDLFIAGEKLDFIARKLKISTANLNNYIKEQRKVEPGRWPYRAHPGQRRSKWG